MFDKEGKGRISAVELRQALTSFRDSLTDEEVDQMIKDKNIDENGMIEIDALVKQICDINVGAPTSEMHKESEQTEESESVADDCN